MAIPLTRMNLSKARLLLVDDSAPALAILASTLLGFGVKRADKCASAREARAYLADLPYDLLLVDHDMPGEDGLAFCQALRDDLAGRNATTPLILLTALPSHEVVAKARDAGATYVVAKPVSPAVLLERIEWIARSGRDFVTSPRYRGPDRRFQAAAPPAGQEDRRRDTRLAEASGTAPPQDDPSRGGPDGGSRE